MKVTYNWLKDFVDITLPPEKLAEKLTMAGLEVESIEEKAGDFVFSIEVTSNRPDWLSVLGIAREVAAITGKKLKAPAPVKGKSSRSDFQLRVENAKDCPLYIARVITGVKVGQAPEWMRKRLELVGVRPVNNAVDITNYVLFELGEPMHAFDLDSLRGGAIVVRRASKGEKLVTIDGKEQLLDPDILVIADAEGPVAVAGVMGGKDTEVGQGTKNILLEAAVFDPVLVRRGRQKLGIQSEASYRFERGVPLEIVEGASCRAEALIRALCSGTGAGMTAKGGSGGKAKTITLDFAAVEKALGCAISPAAIKKILACLGFGVSGAGKKSFNIAIPCHRPDARSGVDLVEEIARVYGYEAVPSALPALIPQPVRERKPFGLIKECLRGQGFDEVITFSLVDRRWLGGKFDEKELIAVTNPLSNEQELLRPTLIPSLARCVSYNLNQRHAAVAIFEVAKSYRAPDKETNVLCLAASGTFTRWFGPEEGNVSYRAGFLALKGCLEALYKTLAISGEPRYEVKDEYEIEVVTRNGKIGMLHKLRPEELSLFDIKDRDVFLAEIDLDLLLPMASSAKKVEAFSRFPRVTRDITLELNASVPVNDILIASRKAGGELMRSVAFKDYYDKNLPAGTKRATISCQYGSLTRTLTDAEVNAAHSGVVEALKKGFSCRIA